jgi:anthranilate/para-aminobenzoate synthase component I
VARATIPERDLGIDVAPRRLCAALRGERGPSLFLEGSDDPDQGWLPLVAVEAHPLLVWGRRVGGGKAPLDDLERIVAERRRRGGGPGTGVAALLGFDLLSPDGAGATGSRDLPDLVVIAVDAAVRFPHGSGPVLAVRAARDGSEAHARVERAVARLGKGQEAPEGGSRPAAAARPLTSLPRERYLRAVEVVKRHIREGDIYQANLTQLFEVACVRDPFDVYRELSDAAPGPRSAFVELGDLAVASVSPETFLRSDREGNVETRPIKGTRPRADDPAEDEALARELLESPKDRAELLMIVDLERNDLGRVCRIGSIGVPVLAQLCSYPAVHHLVARVTGTLVPDAGPARLIGATFPGGSVTGAPKLRALEILRSLEPVPRNFYTGSLLWFGDDGSLESSILIRTVVLSRGRAYLGAGGGVVADSDPEAEWIESGHKARRLAQVLGFAPEEAS